MISMFSYICTWFEEKDMPLCQSLFYSVVICGKVISSIAFSLTMKSPTAQSIFFVCIAGVSVVASIAFGCTKRDSNILIVLPKPEEASRKDKALLLAERLSFCQV